MTVSQVEPEQVGVSSRVHTPAVAARTARTPRTALSEFAPSTAVPPVPDGPHGHPAYQGIFAVEDVQSGQEECEIDGGT